MAYAAFLGAFQPKKEYQKKVDLNYELKISKPLVFKDFG